MKPDEIEGIIARIGYSRRIAAVPDGDGNERLVLFEQLTSKSRAFLDFIYKKELKRAFDDGLMGEGEILRSLAERSLWTVENDRQINYLETELSKLFKEVGATKREQVKVDKLRSSIKLQIQELKNKKATLLAFSAERFAEEQRVRAYVYSCTMSEDGMPIWPSWQHFVSEQDTILINNLITNLISDRWDDLSTSNIREVARSGLWRFKWNAAKAVDKLFGRSVLEMSDEQASLVYWSQIYDSVYEAYERPPQDIISDDEKLDKWMEQQSEKAQHDLKKRFNDSKSKVRASSTDRHGEVYQLANPYLAPVANLDLVADDTVQTPEEVYSKNTDLGRKFIAYEDRKIRQAGGYIQEEDLRSDADSRRMIGSNDAVTHIGPSHSDGPVKGMPTRHVDKLLPGGSIQGRRV